MAGDRTYRPADVEHQLRQASGYGCCRCGFPVFQYHHIILASVEDHNRPEDMMTLCPICHDMATKGAFTLDEQRDFQHNPFNIQRSYADGLLKSTQDYPGVQIGGVILVNDGPVIVTDDETLLALRTDENGRLLISIVLKNESNDVLAVIEDNYWVSGDPSVFDLQADYHKLKINYRPSGVALRIDMRGEPLQVRARLWHNGVLFDLTPSEVATSNAGSLRDMGLANAVLKLNSETHELSIEPKPDQHMTLVSEPDPILRLMKTRAEYRKIAGIDGGAWLYRRPEPGSN